MQKVIKKIALLTSGGDAPGMNAAIRAVVRTAIYHDLEVVGIMHGYDGLINDEFIKLQASSVANIIQRGGTILKTARSARFMTDEGMDLAFNNFKKHNVDALITVGGDGTFRGAKVFGDKYKFSIVGIPGTIDNDLVGTDLAIGYDTAINTVVDAVDKIRDTAESHDRLFFVEVMGRDAGLIALRSGIAAGAEAILMPETLTNIDILVDKLKNVKRKKSSKIIIVAEGDEAGGAFEIAKKVTDKVKGYDARITILGHIQRGGAPTCMDRVNASRLGHEAVLALINGKRDLMVGVVNKKIEYTPFEKAVKHIQKMDPDLVKMLEVLSL
ncbi:MAG: 6-phosphofructokinase [Bacteroidetes bacterium]|nr:6-phosphofructokinase [Bacteroidota bacterium]